MPNQVELPCAVINQILRETIRLLAPPVHQNIHTQPPATRLSLATRAEASKFFYRESRFYLAMNRYTPVRTPTTTTRYRRHHLDLESSAFLQHTTGENVARIRHVDVLLWSPVGGSWRSNRRFDARVVVPLDAGPGAVASLEWRHELSEYGWDEPKLRMERGQYEDKLRVVLDRFAGAGFQVTKENLLALCEELSRGLPGSQAVSLEIDFV